MLSILFLLCESALVRKEVKALATLDAEKEDAGVLAVDYAPDEEPTVEEVDVECTEAEENEAQNKCVPDDEAAEPDTTTEALVQVEDTFDIASAFAGDCGSFKGDFYDHFYNVSRGSTKNVLYLYPGEDHNDAFRLNTNLCDRLKGWYTDAASVHMYHVNSVAHAKRIVEQYSYDSIMLTVMGGHGSAKQLHWGSGSSCGTSHLCKEDSTTESFLKTLAGRMHEHGSIFMDSCLTASDDRGLSWWVSQKVAKGIRVMGSIVSFSTVHWGRFGAGNYVNTVVADGRHVKVKHYKTGGRCPSFSKSSTPDSDGECECRSGTCRYSGGKCPLVRKGEGGTSSRYFMPGCATIGDRQGKCTCS